MEAATAAVEAEPARAALVPRDGAALEDVEDVMAFASWMAERQFRDDEYVAVQEATSVAVVLIYELHEGWDSTRCAKFSAYLLTYLPRRLTSWWRSELRQSGRGSYSAARNEYTYHRTVSLDQAIYADADPNRMLMPMKGVHREVAVYDRDE